MAGESGSMSWARFSIDTALTGSPAARLLSAMRASASAVVALVGLPASAVRAGSDVPAQADSPTARAAMAQKVGKRSGIRLSFMAADVTEGALSGRKKCKGLAAIALRKRVK